MMLTDGQAVYWTRKNCEEIGPGQRELWLARNAWKYVTYGQALLACDAITRWPPRRPQP